MSAEPGLPGSARDPDARERRRYSQPMLRRISMVAGEVLALGCKTSLGPTGPIGASCTSLPCVDDGS